mgnify:FL=1
MTDITSKNQYFFDFGRDFDARLDNFFFTQKNKIIESEIAQFVASDEKQEIFIYGDNSSGKTFLLNSILNATSDKLQSGIYIDLGNIISDKRIFDHLTEQSLICLDNIDQCNEDLQLSIFNLINETKYSDTKLIITSKKHISEIVVFADLKSRLQHMKFFTLHMIADDEVIHVLEFISKKLDLNLNYEIFNFLATRVKRDFSHMKNFLIDFDKFLYAEKKQPSKKTVASFLKNFQN